jgi:hypothetical protein
MQQRELGLPIQNLSPVDQPLQHSIEAFIQAAPEIFQTESNADRQSEHRRTLCFQGYLLTVIYDLLILGEQQAQILDWKTYPRPQQSKWLAQRWQTRLYPFVLAETSPYPPEQISMTYWFIQAEPTPSRQPESYRFIHSAALHQQTSQALVDLLNQLTKWLHGYEVGHPFPQTPESTGHCDSCSFALRCQRGSVGQSMAFPQLDWAEIEEIAL